MVQAPVIADGFCDPHIFLLKVAVILRPNQNPDYISGLPSLLLQFKVNPGRTHLCNCKECN